MALTIFIANCWWDSVTAAYVGSVVPLAIQCAHASYRGGEIREALIFGGVVGGMWPAGEWAVVHTVGWWGAYLKPDLAILETPLYAVFIAWLASTYCVYVGIRVHAVGYGLMIASVISATSALAIGALGENLFVWAGLWRYEAAALRFGAVPAFIPVSYGLSYAAAPFVRRLPVWQGALAITLAMLVVSVGLGLAAGFFPR
ncbi:MAG: hypothetical protein HZB26_10655 [Candidatus Hydrogenedentes bacterium]|nr:hypothetical protein [Candidatus Hydrogenedentota bacterium]